MAEQINSGSGTQYPLIINADGSINTVVSGITIDIGSAIIALEDVYVRSGNIAIVEENPIADNKNNPAWQFDYMISGTTTGITAGSYIGSIIQFIGAGSYVQTLTYVNDNISSIGSWT